MTMYLIWSAEHEGWWGPDGLGYVCSVAEAGRYSRDEAMEICRNALPGQWVPGLGFPEVPIAQADALDLEAEGRRLLAGRRTR
jgi:hypothetical protein